MVSISIELVCLFGCWLSVCMCMCLRLFDEEREEYLKMGRAGLYLSLQSRLAQGIHI